MYAEEWLGREGNIFIRKGISSPERAANCSGVDVFVHRPCE